MREKERCEKETNIEYIHSYISLHKSLVCMYAERGGNSMGGLSLKSEISYSIALDHFQRLVLVWHKPNQR